MKHLVPSLLGAALLLTLPAAAHAQRMSRVKAGQIMQFCTGSDRALVQSCEAYINGVSDTITAYEKTMRDGSTEVKVPMELCIAPDVTGVRLRETVVSWLRQNPDARDQEAHAAVARALIAAYPCRHAGGGSAGGSDGGAKK